MLAGVRHARARVVRDGLADGPGQASLRGRETRSGRGLELGALFDQLGSAIEGIIESPVVRLLSTAFVAYVILLWLACIWWVLQDMRRRHEEPAMAYVAAGAMVLASPVLFPLAVVVYRILRPGRTLAEARELALTERLEELDAEEQLSCPGCSRAVEDDWLVCPACRTRLAHRCRNCGRTMGLDWSLCAWCGNEFGSGVMPDRLPQPARRARRGEVRRLPSGDETDRLPRRTAAEPLERGV